MYFLRLMVKIFMIIIFLVLRSLWLYYKNFLYFIKSLAKENFISLKKKVIQ